MSLILALLMQVGPFAGSGASQGIPQPPAAGQRKVPKKAAPPPNLPPPPVTGRLQACLDDAEAGPADAIDTAEDWLSQSKGAAQVEPNHCLGAAHARRGEWGEAETAFLAARDAAPANDKGMRAKFGGMGGNAALAGQAPERALPILEQAHTDANSAGDIKLAGEVAIDRARALVALKREDEAVTLLVEARTSSTDNPLAWLLSATLSRRQGKLKAAQAQIATAAQLAPTDPEVGLEAGVIAVLAGNDEAARKSWQSVIAAAPASDAANTARGYLAQLDPQPTTRP